MFQKSYDPSNVKRICVWETKIFPYDDDYDDNEVVQQSRTIFWA